MGLPLVSNELGNNFLNTQRGMTLSPAPVSTLQCTLPSRLGPMSAGIFTVVKASVLILVLMSATVICTGSAPSHLWSCRSATSATLTSSSWGLWSAPRSTTSVHLYLHCWQLQQWPPCLFLVPSGFLVACGPPLLLQHSCQWPVWPQPVHTESLAGHEDLPGTCDFVQLPHVCCAVLVVWDFCFWGHCHWCCCFWWQIAFTVYEPVRPIAFMLSEMAMCMQHNSNISEVVAINFRARSLQTRSVSDRAWTKQYLCSFHSLHWRENHISQQGHRCIL